MTVEQFLFLIRQWEIITGRKIGLVTMPVREFAPLYLECKQYATVKEVNLQLPEYEDMRLAGVRVIGSPKNEFKMVEIEEEKDAMY